MRILLTSVAVLALAATPAAAQHGGGKGNGGGNGGGGGHQSQGVGGGNGGSKGGGGGDHAKGNSGKAQAAHSQDRGEEQARQQPRGDSHAQTNRGNENRGGGKHEARAFQPANTPGNSGGKPGNDNRAWSRPASAAGDMRGDGGKGGGGREKGKGNDDRSVQPFRWSSAPRLAPVDGCPPGLAKKNNGCTPPGLVRANPWQSYYERPDWWGHSDWQGGRSGYYDGYLLRYNGDRITSYVPLLGGALAVGGLWPDYYEPVELPGYYQDYYSLGPSYRYSDDVLYRVDPGTSTIESIAALLTGDDFAIGQPMPESYDVYNVPYGYRDRYPDSEDAMYRYSDGYVYEVDPTTRLVQAAIQLLL